jgi:hypothetical protein
METSVNARRACQQFGELWGGNKTGIFILPRAAAMDIDGARAYPAKADAEREMRERRP